MGYCTWDNASELMARYHEEEWGVPLHDDRGQFEFLTLEVMQCGISWAIVMKKREIIRGCFDGFDYERIARYSEADIDRIMAVPGMIKNRRKTEAVITNARAFIRVREEFGSFSDYIWHFTGGCSILYEMHEDGWIPASNGLSEDVSADLKRRGFKFTGPVVMYSHMQACGLINDHDKDCACYGRLIREYPTVRLERSREKDVRYYGDK